MKAITHSQSPCAFPNTFPGGRSGDNFDFRGRVRGVGPRPFFSSFIGEFYKFEFSRGPLHDLSAHDSLSYRGWVIHLYERNCVCNL